ncbi:MAG TPA: nucleotidyl transferase AbiEii/AbiGii toxin family protein [Chitinophagales bacterium]|nr:nucleotidyl transferase AbiEii/AbiGii toxin family protein [Chitinophagales bacterium]
MSSIIRKATQQEIEFTHNVMYPLQDKVLACMNSEGFYLTGGTCLSRFYLHHRYSEDLDFFYEARRFPSEEFEGEARQFIGDLRKTFQLKLTIDSKTFKRIIIEHENVELKVELINDPIEAVGERIKNGNFKVDTLVNIGSNKITTVYGRKAAKDYVDLFFLLKQFSLNELIEGANRKMIPLKYEEASMALNWGKWDNREVLLFNDITEEEFTNFVVELNRKLLEHARTV